MPFQGVTSHKELQDMVAVGFAPMDTIFAATRRIIARTDALFYKLPIEEAIRRAVAFEQAGRCRARGGNEAGRDSSDRAGDLSASRVRQQSDLQR